MLSMAERAELVGGTLTVRSRPGDGTTVTVTVPIDQ
jgi:two-component system NarL family sensor kinase